MDVDNINQSWKIRLKRIVDEATDEELGTVDYKKVAESLFDLLRLEDLKEKHK